MKIVILGAGAIGSLFGAFLSQTNEIILVGRTPHVKAIQQNGLKINGKTRLHIRLSAVDTIQQVSWPVDLLLLSVKSYDTEKVIQQVAPYLNQHTIVLSLQNGLNNIDLIRQSIDPKQIIAGVTTHGAIFFQPGVIHHTGFGNIILGELDGVVSPRIHSIIHLFNQAGLPTKVSDNIIRDIWVKTIINSSINPLTAFFACKNGYLLKNPVLEQIVERICDESTTIATCEGISISLPEMITRTKEVIRTTATNESSMLQSVKNKKRTEINAINGALVPLGKKHGVDVSINELLVYLIASLECKK